MQLVHVFFAILAVSFGVSHPLDDGLIDNHAHSLALRETPDDFTCGSM